MTTPNPLAHFSAHQGTSAAAAPFAPRPAYRIVAVAAALAGAFANSAYSQGFGPPWQHRPFFGIRRSIRPLSKIVPTGWCAISSVEVDATAEQQEKLRGIVRAAVHDLLPLREKAMNSRQRGRELLTQTTIDRAAIESLPRRADGARRPGEPQASRRRSAMPPRC